MTSKPATADEQARLIFYKIETLVFDAVRQEFAEMTAPLIKAHLEEQALKDAPNPSGEAGTQTPHQNQHDNQQDNQQDPYQVIRALITGFVHEALEEQAPHNVAQILAKAFAATDAPKSPPRSQG